MIDLDPHHHLPLPHLPAPPSWPSAPVVNVGSESARPSHRPACQTLPQVPGPDDGREGRLLTGPLYTQEVIAMTLYKHFSH